MKYHFKNNGSDTLIVFVTGWSMDQHITQHLDDEKADVLTLFEYHTDDTFDFDFNVYQKRILIAFSLGVHAASHFLKDYESLFDVKIAINGTDTPVHDAHGIPPQVFEMTIEKLSPSSKVKFDMRACGGNENYQKSSISSSKRSLESMLEEIQWSYQQSQQPSVTPIQWDIALISLQDLIFPVNHMKDYWSSVNTKWVTIDTPHIPFLEFRQWSDIISLNN